MSEVFGIGELAREFEVTTRAIRFYEDQGLLAPARNGRNRVYSQRDRVRLRLILRGKRLGLSLGDIREVLDLYDTPAGEKAQLQRLRAKIRDRRAALEKQRQDIDIVLRELDVLEAQCEASLERDKAG